MSVMNILEWEFLKLSQFLNSRFWKFVNENEEETNPRICLEGHIQQIEQLRTNDTLSVAAYSVLDLLKDYFVRIQAHTTTGTSWDEMDDIAAKIRSEIKHEIAAL